MSTEKSKKFRVSVIFDGVDLYEIEAKDEDEAREKVLSGDFEPVDNDNENYAVDWVEEVKNVA